LSSPSKLIEIHNTDNFMTVQQDNYINFNHKTLYKMLIYFPLSYHLKTSVMQRTTAIEIQWETPLIKPLAEEKHKIPPSKEVEPTAHSHFPVDSLQTASPTIPMSHSKSVRQ